MFINSTETAVIEKGCLTGAAPADQDPWADIVITAAKCSLGIKE